MSARCTAATLLLLWPTGAAGASLHGRIKNQQCAVLSHITVRLRPVPAHGSQEHTATTDDSGNYTAELPPGEYQLCIQGKAQDATSCAEITVAGTGDTWLTTQVRDTVPDLSSFGNRSY